MINGVLVMELFDKKFKNYIRKLRKERGFSFYD